jgi:hypothetical protein
VHRKLLFVGLVAGACVKVPEFRGGTDGGFDARDSDSDGDAASMSCRQAIEISGLLVYLPLDSVTGGVTSDASPNHHDGTVLGGAALGPGYHGMGMVLDGGSKAITLGSPAALDNLSSLTVCAWLNPSVLDRTNPGATIADKSNDGYDGGWNAYLDFEPTSLHVGYLAREGVWGYGVSTVPISTWTHACTVWSNGALTIYVNAQLDALATMGMIHGLPAHDDAANDLVLGRQTNANQYPLNGTLDDFVLYDRALDANEIAAIHGCSP